MRRIKKMNSNDFISQHDPSKDMSKELEDVDISKQYSKLTEDEKILVFMKIKGFSHRPPTMERLYSDEYYLGSDHFFNGGRSVFQFWKDMFKFVVPNEVTTRKPLLVLSGALGIGKSSVSKLLILNTLARLSCMINPWRTFGLARKPLSILVMHKNTDICDREFRRYITDDVYLNSPFFKNLPHDHKIKIVVSSDRGSSGIGTDTIMAILSEVSWWNNEQRAIEKVNSTYIRVTSRFDVRDSLTIAGGYILDSSAHGTTGPLQAFLENAEPEFTWNCSPSHWQVRPEIYRRSEEKTFPIYIGDGKRGPAILPEDYVLAEDQDPDRVIKVPIQLYPEAKSSLTQFLMDKAGVSVGSIDRFFDSMDHLVNCFTIKNRIPEVITVDFYDKTDRLYPKVEPMLNLLPRSTFIVIGLDLAIVGDFAGVSASSFWGWKDIDGVKVPTYRNHFTLALSRKENQQTSIFHIFELILDMRKKFPNIMVSADKAYSTSVIQECLREGIPVEYISTDNSPCEPALYLKNVIYNEQIMIPENRRLLREAHDLITTSTNTGKFKVDHPKKATQDPKVFDINNGVGSKDCWDALSSSIYAIKKCIDEGNEMGYTGSYMKQSEAMKTYAKDDPKEISQRIIQGMLEDIFQ